MLDGQLEVLRRPAHRQLVQPPADLAVGQLGQGGLVGEVEQRQDVLAVASRSPRSALLGEPVEQRWRRSTTSAEAVEAVQQVLRERGGQPGQLLVELA